MKDILNFEALPEKHSRSLIHVNTHVRTQWLFYEYEVSPHFHHYHIHARSRSFQFSLPWWPASNVDSHSCPSPSRDTHTSAHAAPHAQIQQAYNWPAHWPVCPWESVWPPRAIRRAVNLANCVNTWLHRSCVYTLRCFSHAAGIYITLYSPRSLNSPLPEKYGT